MSADHAQPISPADFQLAISELDVPLIEAKLAEFQSSISHLERSNQELRDYVQSVPQDDNICEEAIAENEGVIERMKQRIQLCEAEIEKQGGSAHR